METEKYNRIYSLGTILLANIVIFLYCLLRALNMLVRFSVVL